MVVSGCLNLQLTSQVWSFILEQLKHQTLKSCLLFSPLFVCLRTDNPNSVTTTPRCANCLKVSLGFTFLFLLSHTFIVKFILVLLHFYNTVYLNSLTR